MAEGLSQSARGNREYQGEIKGGISVEMGRKETILVPSDISSGGERG